MRKRILSCLLILITLIFAASCDSASYTSFLAALQGNQYIAAGLVDSPDIIGSYEVTTTTTSVTSSKTSSEAADGTTTYTVTIAISTDDDSLTDEQKSAYSTINSVLSSLTVTSEDLANVLVSSDSSSTLSILTPSTSEEAETISELVSVSSSSTAASAQFVETYSEEVTDEDTASATIGSIAVFAAVLDSYTATYSDELTEAAESDSAVSDLIDYVNELTETLTTIATSSDVTVTEGDVLQAQLLIDFTATIVEVLNKATGTSSTDTDTSAIITSAIDSLTTIESAASLLSGTSGCLSSIGLDSIISSVLSVLTGSTT